LRRLSLVLLTAALLAAGLTASARSDSDSTRTFHVKITNLTPATAGQPPAPAGQPMSPPLWAVHSKKVDLWSVGALASSGMLPIVEDALNTPLQTYLSSNPHVAAVKTETGSPAGPIPPGRGAREFDVSTHGDAKFLSMVWMLVRTNDGFTGLDTYKLAGRKGRTRTLWLGAYDGGTENNNQSCAYIPGPPCGKFFVRDPTAQPIAPHPGITGGDIGAFAWTNPVAKVEITRTS
jgi:hypothetical protein